MVSSLLAQDIFIRVELPRSVCGWIIEYIALVKLDTQNIKSGNYWTRCMWNQAQ